MLLGPRWGGREAMDVVLKLSAWQTLRLHGLQAVDE